MDKSPDAFRTISEVAEWLGVQTHVLRFWESKFTQVKPVKRAGGRRYYRPSDMQLLGGIKQLLHDDGMTIKGVQKLLREEGTAHVAGFSRELDSPMAEDVPQDAAENVVPFNARPDEAPQPEPETAAAPADPAADAPSPLPAFLTQPMGAGPDAPKPNIVDAPDPPAEETLPVQPGVLGLLKGLNALEGETSKSLTPLLGRLAVLRDSMAQAAQ